MLKSKKLRMVAVLIVGLFALTLLDVIPGLSVLASTQETTAEIGFYVRAVLPENQVDNRLSYFDLRMEPGQTQTIEVEVVNETDQPITVNMSAISASTNRNGVIDYKTPNIRDKTLEIPFSEIASLASDSLTIAPRGTSIAQATVVMPQESYDGVILGGLVFTRETDDVNRAAEGAVLQNVYTYVLGIKLNETDAVVLPDFELESVEAETVNYQPALVHYIRNFEAAIVKNMDLHVVITDDSGQVVADVTRSNIDMAPNSIMPLAVTPVYTGGSTGEGSNSGGQIGTTGVYDGYASLQAGDYTSNITLTLDDETWALEQRFTVGSVEAQNLNNTLPGAAAARGRNTTLIVLLIIAAIVIIALAIIIFLLAKRRKKEEEDEARYVHHLKP